MQDNLASLEEQTRTIRNGDPDRSIELNARYDAYCRTSADPTPPASTAEDMPLDPDAAMPDQPTIDQPPRVAARPSVSAPAMAASFR